MIQKIEELDRKLLVKKKELDKLFEISCEDIFVMILPKSDFQKLKQEEWVVGFTFPKSKIVFVMEQKESGRSYDEWLKVIVHEMVHLYYYKKFKSSEPKWFFEGLACYIAGQEKENRKVSLKDLISLHADCKDKEVYSIGYNVIKKLVEK